MNVHNILTNSRNITTAIKDLEKAQAVVEKGWTKGDFAQDVGGYGVLVDSKSATCFCAMGGIAKAKKIDTNEVEDTLAFDYLTLAMTTGYSHLDAGWVPYANDAEDTTQDHVLMAFDFAILMAKDDLKELKKKAKKK